MLIKFDLYLVLIISLRPIFTMQYFDGKSAYSQEEIDEVRDSWVTYVLKNKHIDKHQGQIVGMDFDQLLGDDIPKFLYKSLH